MALPPTKWSITKDYLKLSTAALASIDNSVKEFIPEDDIRKRALDAIHGRVSEDYFNGVKLFAKASVVQRKVVAYDGFYPHTIIQEFDRKANANRAGDGPDFEFTVDGIQFHVPRASNVVKDVQLFVTLFLIRGNNLFKVLKTVSKEAKSAVSRKILNYEIKSDNDAEAAARKRKERAILTSKHMTLSRIAASFPHVTLAMAKTIQAEGKANCNAIKLQAKMKSMEKDVPPMPYILQHGMIPALLRKSEPSEEQSFRQFCYMFKLEQTITLQLPNIKKQMLNEPLITQVDNSMKFVSAAINGSLSSDAERLSLRKELIGSETDAIDFWVKAGADAWIKALSASTYSSLITVMSQEHGMLVERAASTSASK